ncbi:hypothetical protein NQ317_013994 [Molorchus minor]|uniref:CUB domain-containing protein n=1 Tax=Molorchus minor TaxID=1323400 RepID=A0ABQ9JG77_9CUCU|nr:hypothetical protein NQ317_013994 [Molorchus minor]
MIDSDVSMSFDFIAMETHMSMLGTPTGIIYDGVGNYSLSSKCSWLIYAPNSTITLHVEEFSTECGWDHLYVFDGDSVESPLLAVFSGVMYKNSYSLRRIPEIVAQIRICFNSFFSDDANNMSGFNLTYRINACPSMKQTDLKPYYMFLILQIRDPNSSLVRTNEI